MTALQLKLVQPLSIPLDVEKNLRYLAIAGYPFEVCGIIHTHNIVHQYANVYAGDHCLGFDMEIDLDDPTIKAIWHSHPQGLEHPSDDDYPCMQSLAEHGFLFRQFIVTPKRVLEYDVSLTAA